MAEAYDDPKLVSPAEVQDRLPYPVTDPHVERVVTEVIVDASNLARHYGRETWHADLVPPVVKTEVRNACVRALVLLDGVVQSRAGDESEMYTDLRALTGTVFFTEDQKQTIREAAGGGGNWGSGLSYRHSLKSVTRDPDSYIKWPLGDRGFPVRPALSGGGW